MACGGGNQSATTQEEFVEQPAVEKAEQKEEMSPMEIGQKAGELYAQALKDVTELLKEKPEVSAVRAQVEELKESYVQKLVELGRMRESLDESQKSQVDGQIRMKVSPLYKDPVFATFNEIQQHYFNDRDFHKIVIGFNVIGQYANFDLLKKQEPEEAQRLGIE